MVPRLSKRASTDEQTHELAKITAVVTALKTVCGNIRLSPEITLLALIVHPFYSVLPLTLTRVFALKVLAHND